MSGGSWDYVYGRFAEVADRLREARCPRRRALAKVVAKLADTMHAIEWADSGDTSQESATAAVEAFLGRDATRLALAEVVEDAKRVQTELALLITDAEANL